MGQRGPKKTPTAVLAARGSRRAKDKSRQGEPHPEVVIPKHPIWVSPKAKKYWKEIAPMLADYGVITNWDRIALALLVDTLADYIAAKKLIVKHGEITPSKKDAVYQYPAVGIKNRTFENVLKLCREFGLTPASRSNVQIEKASDPKENPKARFFKVNV